MDWCCMLCGMTMIHAAIHFPWEAVNRLGESLQDLSHNRTIDTGSSSWVTACQYMPTYRCLAVTTFSRSLTMYDITSPFCTICGSVPKMDYTPMTMDIWPDRGSMKECEMVIIGDAGGMIHLHRIQPNQKQDSLQVCFGDSPSVCLCMCYLSIMRKTRPILATKQFVRRHRLQTTHHLIFISRQITSLLEILSYSSCKNSYRLLEQTRISPNQSQRYFLLDPVQISVTFPMPTAGCCVCPLS
jgi:hypothetical protein